MRSRRVLVSLLLAAAVCGCASPRPSSTPAPKPTASDPVFLDDFTRLRTEYGERDDFGALCEDDQPMPALSVAFNAEQWQAALDVALPWLERCPVDIDARMVAAVALQQLGRAKEFDEQKRWYDGLVDSVLASGDGKSAKTAFVVISVAEEYAVLRALDLHFQWQALVDGGIDAMTAQGEAGQTTVYFDPAAHFRRLERKLGGK